MAAFVGYGAVQVYHVYKPVWIAFIEEMLALFWAAECITIIHFW